AEEFDPSIAGWVRGSGTEPSGHVELKFNGDAERADAAYWIKMPNGKDRIVLLADGTSVLDTIYPNVVGIARIPQGSAANIKWVPGPGSSITPPGDGFLVVMRNGDNTRATVMFVNDHKVVSGTPRNYESIELQ